MKSFATFDTWVNPFVDDKKSRSVSVNPAEVTDVEDYCGDASPGSVITLKSGKTYLVAGEHHIIMAKLEAIARRNDETET